MSASSPLSVIQQAFADHLAVAQQTAALAGEIAAAAELVVATFRRGGKLLLAGNGGSAADAQHWTAEWVVRLNTQLNRPAMAAIALSTDSSILTAAANDFGVDSVFSRQVEALARPGDLFIAISTSGQSSNLLIAARMARDCGAGVLGILGKGGGHLARLCDRTVIVPSADTQRIQEMHCLIGHLLCELSERAIHGG